MSLVIDLERIAEPEWIEGPAGTRFLIRLLPASVRGKILNGAENDTEAGLSILDYLVQDWEGLVGGNGEPVPCNGEMKRLVFDYRDDLAQVVLDGMEEVQRRRNQRQETELKNSETS